MRSIANGPGVRTAQMPLVHTSHTSSAHKRESTPRRIRDVTMFQPLLELPSLSTLAAVFFGTFFAISLVAGAGEKLSSEFPWQFRLAAKMRTPMLVFLVVPVSCAYRCFISMRDWVRALLRGSTGRGAACPAHAARAARVQQQVRAAVAQGQRMRTARSSWQQMSVKLNSNKAGAARIETRHLNHILTSERIRTGKAEHKGLV